jgi:hypothetical protein
MLGAIDPMLTGKFYKELASEDVRTDDTSIYQVKKNNIPRLLVAFTGYTSIY